MLDGSGIPQTLALLGGTSDIGLAIVRRYAELGTQRIVLAGRDRPSLQEVGASVERNHDVPVSIVEFDALEPRTHERAVDSVFEAVGGDLDCCVIAVGILGDQKRAETDVDHLQEILETNFVAPARLGLLVAKRMARQGSGLIVVLSSVAGERVRRSNFVYGSSKAGLDGFFQGLQAALVPDGVRVLIVRPGFVHTKMTRGMEPPPLSATPEQVADAVVKGVAQGADIVWVPPSARFVMAVLRHLPAPIFRRLPI